MRFPVEDGVFEPDIHSRVQHARKMLRRRSVIKTEQIAQVVLKPVPLLFERARIVGIVHNDITETVEYKRFVLHCPAQVLEPRQETQVVYPGRQREVILHQFVTHPQIDGQSPAPYSGIAVIELIDFAVGLRLERRAGGRQVEIPLCVNLPLFWFMTTFIRSMCVRALPAPSSTFSFPPNVRRSFTGWACPNPIST